MIIYKLIPDYIPKEIREKFKDFNYEIPIGLEDVVFGLEGIKERKKYYNLLKKIKTKTGYEDYDLSSLISINKPDEFIEEINILNLIRENYYKFDLQMLINILNEIKKRNKEYKTFYINTEMEFLDECSGFSDYGSLADYRITIRGYKEVSIKEHIEIIKEFDKRINNKINKNKKQIEKNKKDKIDKFNKYYEIYKLEIDNLTKLVQDKKITIKNLSNYGFIGQWTKFKIENINKKIQEIKTTPKQMEKVIERAKKVVKNSALWKDGKSNKRVNN